MNIIKKLNILILLFLTTNQVAKSKKQITDRYHACKANCVINGKECPKCIASCQQTKCRTECYKNNEKKCKKSKACKDLQKCMKNNNCCQPSQCLQNCKEQKKCLDECNLIKNKATETTIESDCCTSDCYCFKNTEFLEKILGNNNCLNCQTICSNKYKKYGNQIKGKCK